MSVRKIMVSSIIFDDYNKNELNDFPQKTPIFLSKTIEHF